MAEETFEVETIEAARWEGQEWSYHVKWWNYADDESSWEPVNSLRACGWLLKKFWADVGIQNLCYPWLIEVGSLLYSSPHFRELCRKRLLEPNEEEEEEDEDEDDVALRPTVPADLLWVAPEALGFHGLGPDERFQIVSDSLGSKGYDAYKLLYKKYKKDTQEDVSWLDQDCMICFDESPQFISFLTCDCRSKLYCTECICRYASGITTKDGKTTCPFCSGLVFIVNRCWVTRTPDEERARSDQRKVGKMLKRKLNKHNKKLKRLMAHREKEVGDAENLSHNEGGKERNYDQPTVKTALPRLRLVLNGTDRSSEIKNNIQKLLRERFILSGNRAKAEWLETYRKTYPSSDATNDEILNLIYPNHILHSQS